MSCSSNSLPNSPTNMPPSDFLKRMTEILTKGQASADKLRSRLISNDGTTNAGESSSSKCEEQLAANIILVSFNDGLSLLDACSRDQSDDGPVRFGRSSNSAGEGPNKNNLAVKDGRGCHKRRRTCESRETISVGLMDDGHAWRKYGQKHIQATDYPRSYYRCTHQPDQGCPAKKQVQKVSDKPERYRIIYIDHHTCTHSLQNTSMLSLVDDVRDDKNNMMCFETNNGGLVAVGPNNNNNNNNNNHNKEKEDGDGVKDNDLFFDPADHLCFPAAGTMMMMIEQGQECSHDNDPIKEEGEEDPVVMITMDMKSMHPNSMNLLATEHLYSSSSPPSYTNISSIDRRRPMATVSTGLKYAAGPDHGDASSVGCSGPTTPDSWEDCLDFDSFMNVGYDQDPKVEDVFASLFPVSVNTEEGFGHMNEF